MAIYSTFFVCRPDELPAGFPGWKLPLDKPVLREMRNPFTGQTTVIETREPDWPEEEMSDESLPEIQVVAIQGNYQDYLENRLPKFVRQCQHWAAKGLTQVELGPLLEAIGVPSAFDTPICGPPSAGAWILGFPQQFPVALAALDLNAAAAKWAEMMSTPEYTHSVSGVKLSDGWTTDDALELLRPIAALTQTMNPGQQLYVLIG